MRIFWCLRYYYLQGSYKKITKSSPNYKLRLLHNRHPSCCVPFAGHCQVFSFLILPLFGELSALLSAFSLFLLGLGQYDPRESV
jgi:hypothetical protein